MKPIQIPSRRAVAQELGTSDQYLYQIETRRRLASKLMARAIETATGGKVTRHELRPDLYPIDSGRQQQPSKDRAA
jgi:DNA-binding transcriptional regulator YdaS (Cro superfamily)